MSIELVELLPWIAFIGAALCMLCCVKRTWWTLAGPICVGSIALCFLLAFVTFWMLPEGKPEVVTFFHWLKAGDFHADFAYYLDTLTYLMLFVVTGIGTLIALYATGYMKGDRGYARFFAGVAIFIFAMTSLVMADNLVLLYLGWEGVGFASYFLIGFYYEQPYAVFAAKKAFIVNRIGDFGFALGLFLTYLAFGSVQYADILPAAQGLLGGEIAGLSEGARQAYDSANASGGMLTWIPFLLMLGAFGKSAQIPLFTWLPDAMAGPTPVSALVHAATMVTSGVYMIARLMPLFELSPAALPTVAVIGGLTCFLAATIAMCSNDLKGVFAYSTISQLGYMFIGVGALSTFGGMFHLFTHAWFKALLFLTAGSVMHALAGQLDIRTMSGLRHKMPVTCWLMFAGCLALAGFPLTAGFVSKDTILAESLAYGINGSPAYMVAALFGLVTAFLTAFYTFRLWCRVFLGPERYEMGQEHHDEEADPHAHESEIEADHETHHAHEPHEMPWWPMNAPLAVLAVGSILVGLIFASPIQHWVENSSANPQAIPDVAQNDIGPHAGGHTALNRGPWPALSAETRPIAVQARRLNQGDDIHLVADNADPSPQSPNHQTAKSPKNAPAHASEQTTDHASHASAEGEHHNPHHATLLGMDIHLTMQLLSSLLALAGIGLAGYFHWWDRQANERVAARVWPVVTFLRNKWYVDEVYDGLIVRPLRLGSQVLFAFDQLVLDYLVLGVGSLPGNLLGRVARQGQTGRLQGYGLGMVGGIAVLAVVIFFAIY